MTIGRATCITNRKETDWEGEVHPCGVPGEGAQGDTCQCYQDWGQVTTGGEWEPEGKCK